jgi:hypothetical protein
MESIELSTFSLYKVEREGKRERVNLMSYLSRLSEKEKKQMTHFFFGDLFNGHFEHS